ncbi:hypothetical protein DOS84_14130 [Flavobacterium aquariorum]|jgi:hypothetical protein|uniref:Preprotein translocase subunit SecB n=1 Tax=Flavobacterium aquariorum TaxID=2217670 RepID=A0A2W7UGW6_9FLAO|nr:hypothetical protein [Flavobacterium aquariorum]PZX92595.1 hypothetical protein DOS84_14130 [Flavobacterium aquariorum]
MSANILHPEKIEIVDFKIIKGQINSPFDFENKKVEGHIFNVDFELGFNLEDKLARADFSVNVETKSNGDTIEEAVGNFSFVYVFYVDNIEELTTVEKDEIITVHPALGNALASITYSTSRGILMTRFQGTVLSDFILPVINPNDLLEKGKK